MKHIYIHTYNTVESTDIGVRLLTRMRMCQVSVRRLRIVCGCVCAACVARRRRRRRRRGRLLVASAHARLATNLCLSACARSIGV